MTLTEFFSGKPRGAKAQFAKTLGVSKTWLSLVIAGRQQASPELSRDIELATGGAVKRAEMRPDIFGGRQPAHAHKARIQAYMTQTAHLADAEDLAYRRLLDLYYLTEKPLPLDLAEVSRLIRLDDDVVEPVLRELFQRTPNGYIHPQADAEIARNNRQINLEPGDLPVTAS